MTFNICVRESYVNADDDDQYRFSVAATTCLPDIDTLCPSAAEHGAVVTQALTSVRLGGRGMDYLKDGLAIDDALQALLSADDGQAERQLHGAGSEATFTFAGGDCLSQAGHHEGDAYTVAGDLLTGETAVDATADACERTVDGDEPLAKRLIDVFGSRHTADSDKRDNLVTQSTIVTVAPAESREMEPRYNGFRVGATETPLCDLRETFPVARKGYEVALEKYAGAQPGGVHTDPETVAVGSNQELGEVVTNMVDGFNDLTGITDKVNLVFERATCDERLAVNLPRDNHQIARLDGFVDFGDTRMYYIGPAKGKRDRASADRDDVRRRRKLVRAPNRER